MATILDVAEYANVSKSTVSLVLNGSPLVKEETRRKVQKAISDLKYVPNYNARNLVRKSNECIGIIHALKKDRSLKRHYGNDYGLEQFSRDIEDGIFEAILETNNDISVIKEHYLFSPGAEKPRIIQSKRVDGAIFLGIFSDDDIEEIMSDVDLPVVLIGSCLNTSHFDVVLHDPVKGTYLAAKKLMETGHKRICLINCPKSFQVWPMRIEGLRKAAAEYGYSLDDDFILSVEQNTADGAYITANAFLDAGHRPDAIISADNEIALGVLRCLYERGIRVPDDISIISYEDSNICGNVAPSLSAINIQKEFIGQMSLRLLLDRINDRTLPPRSAVVQPYLVMRASVKERG